MKYKFSEISLVEPAEITAYRTSLLLHVQMLEQNGNLEHLGIDEINRWFRELAAFYRMVHDVHFE